MAADKRKASRHTEIERKFAVTDATVPRRSRGCRASRRVERLARTTPRRRLLRHAQTTTWPHTASPCGAAPAVTDAGWHLKLPAGPDSRTEVRRAVGRGRRRHRPEELRDVVLAIVRAASRSRPVARIATTRTVDVLYDVRPAAPSPSSATTWSPPPRGPTVNRRPGGSGNSNSSRALTSTPARLCWTG